MSSTTRSLTASADAFPLLRTEIAGLSVDDLARQFGTPFYAYDAAKIQERIEDLRLFDAIRYAQKANSNLAILDLVRRAGVLVDAVSAGEVQPALAAGYAAAGDPPPIVYTADIFDRESLDLVVSLGLHVNCGSPDMIDQLGEPRRAVRSRCVLTRASAMATAARRTPAAISRSTASGTNSSTTACVAPIIMAWPSPACTCTSDRARTWRICRKSANRWRSWPWPRALDHLDQRRRRVAGAVPLGRVVCRPRLLLRPVGQDAEAAGTRFGHPVHLEIEPGRYLVAESGYLVSEIRAIKHMGANTFYLLDAGFNNLARPILYGSYHPMSIVPRGGDKSQRPLVDVVVGGPLCESGDIFTQTEGGFVATRNLPAAQVGDLVAIENAGAYGAVMGSNYNSKPLAAELLIRAGQSHLVRRRQSFEDIARGESIPAAE